MMGKPFNLRNCFLIWIFFWYLHTICFIDAFERNENIFLVSPPNTFFRFLRRKYSARCCCLHTSNARYLEYGTSSNKGSFFVASFLDKHSWYISADCILSNCFNNKNGWFCNGAVVLLDCSGQLVYYWSYFSW